ncbi:MAG: hypothetical protein WEA99_02420 [Brumimicrobium sp.]
MYLIDNSIKSICGNCKHTLGCSLKNGASHIINSCEEHESETLETVRRRMDEPPMQTTFKGLCSNCDYQDTCTIGNKGNIIFSCEEYK